jgi:hypothetical protein
MNGKNLNADFTASCPSHRPSRRSYAAAFATQSSWTALVLWLCATLLYLHGATVGMPVRDGGRSSGPPAGAGLIVGIERDTIWRGRDSGTVWFHPRGCLIPGKQPLLLMTLQPISGSDVFGPVHWTESNDLGHTWSDPKPIPGLGRTLHADGIEEGVCDVVPEYHVKTGTVLAMGHNVYYKDNRLTRPNEQRWPIYVVRSATGQWSEPRRLLWDHPEATAMYTSGCAQRISMPSGDILVPLSFGPLGREDRAVGTVLCTFNGKELKVKRSSNVLHLAVKRGLLEPSLAFHRGRYFMTIRAEDDRGYVAASRDGLAWEEKKPWCWDDGEPLELSTTQQRWLPHSDGLFLVYTRKTAENAKVMRWRTPLFIAEVDTRNLTLIRKTEKVVLPLAGDPVNDPAGVAHLGNFHTAAVSPWESIITVGEVIPKSYRGDTLIARIRWARPNPMLGTRVER